jgi:DNA-binding protein HU-beta
MNKAELVEKIADDAELSKASAERALNSAIENISWFWNF